MKDIVYILSFYDPHHTVDGSVKTMHFSTLVGARDHLDRIRRSICWEHEEGPQEVRHCLRDVHLEKRTTTIETEIMPV